VARALADLRKFSSRLRLKLTGVIFRLASSRGRIQETGHLGYSRIRVRKAKMISTVMRRAAVSGALVVAAVLLTVSAAAGASASSRPQHRQLAVSALSNFKVVLTATRGSGNPPGATVTATGYRRHAGHWDLISTQRVGKPGGWSWFAVDTCSLTATQFRSRPRSRRVASIRVSLLATPSIGCTRPYSLHWRP
jgi:hypothetical protein